VFIVALGMSVFGLTLTWYWSGDPLFAKETFVLPRFRFRNYESLSHHVNGNGLDHGGDKSAVLEDFIGWRFRMGVLYSATLLALTIVHAVVLVENGSTFLRIVFVAFWALPFSSLLTVGYCFHIQHSPLPSHSVSPVSLQLCVWPRCLSTGLPFSYRHSPSPHFELAVPDINPVGTIRLAIHCCHRADCIGQRHPVIPNQLV
jgi:hypothetical protein